MSAVLLRATAVSMRALALSATAGPWETSDCEGGPLVERVGTTGEIVAGCGWWERPKSRANANHVAAWSPPVALAVAAWLDAEASELELRKEWGFPQVPASQACAVARAFNGAPAAPPGEVVA